jgi:hypothetical protein
VDSLPTIPSDAEDGLELSFKTPPARTYAHHMQRRKSELHELIVSEQPLFEQDEENQEMDEPSVTDKANDKKKKKIRKKKEQVPKGKLGSWDNAIKKNVSFVFFLRFVHRLMTFHLFK